MMSFIGIMGDPWPTADRPEAFVGGRRKSIQLRVSSHCLLGRPSVKFKKHKV